MTYLLGAASELVAARVRRNILRALSEFADPQWQRRVWIDAKGPEMSSYVEANESLFGDSNLARTLDAGDVVFDPDTDATLRQLQSALSHIDARESEATITSRADWPTVVDLARRARDRIATIHKPSRAFVRTTMLDALAAFTDTADHDSFEDAPSTRARTSVWEAYLTLFGDSGFDDAVRANEPLIDVEIDALLGELRSVLNGIDLQQRTPTLVQDPRWGDVVKRVAVLRARLLKLPIEWER